MRIRRRRKLRLISDLNTPILLPSNAVLPGKEMRRKETILQSEMRRKEMMPEEDTILEMNSRNPAKTSDLR